MKLPQTNLKSQYTALKGGEDLISSSLTVSPERALFTMNYELDINGRFRLIDGFEVFDGHPKPSAASYWKLNFDAGTSAINVGQILTGAGGAYGEVLHMVLESGTWAGSDATGYVLLFNVVGTFINNEQLTVSATPKATANGTATERGLDDDTDDWHYVLAAIEATRDDIAAVPGEGPIRGIWQYNGVKYAFRDNGSGPGTAVAMYKSTTAGWSQCSLGERLGFTTGTAEVVEGEVLTQAGVTATVRRVIVKTGAWSTGDAAGYMVISGRDGGHFAAGAATGSITGALTVAGIETANAFTVPGGRFEFVNENFGGHASTQRMYGCDGKNKAFEWDGTYFTPIETGMTIDTPEHIGVFRGHLFLAFSGGSLQHSAPGEPFLWSVVLGAGEIGLGDEITGLTPLIDSMVLFGRNRTKILYGYDTDTWDLRDFADDSGAIEWTIQSIEPGVILTDDRGIASLSSTQAYGDFKSGTLSQFIDPYIKTKLTSIQGSMRVKEKSQYRLFFDNGTAVTLTLSGNKVVGITRQSYGITPVCFCSSEYTTGKEELFFGDDDGFVYQMDSGNSFNGEPIEAALLFHYNHLNSPRLKKRLRRLILELDAPKYTYLNIGIQFDYGVSFNPSTASLLGSLNGGAWDIDDWDTFVWDGVVQETPDLDIDGTALNFSLMVYHSGEYELQTGLTNPQSGITGSGSHTLQGYIVYYDTRGVQR